MKTAGSTDERRLGGRYETTGDDGLVLHVDVDGPYPLGVVSGTLPPLAKDEGQRSFIGRVEGSRELADGLELAVVGFSLPRADSAAPLEALSLTLRASAGEAPRATACFRSADGEQLEPLELLRASPYFREVVIDVDYERGEGSLPTINTHEHPEHPEDLPARDLSLEGVYADAGIRIEWADDPDDTVPSSEAGEDGRWSLSELHDSMELHWEAFANVPQWKAWLFVGREAESDLGGIMFDANIDEPGGVDRQGVALFSQCEYFHLPSGALPSYNPPADAAARRELFFNLVHELGHSFNLAHPFEARSGTPWTPPAWWEGTREPDALTWMNYPNRVHTDWTSLRTEWFYRRFRFRFDPWELLFLRHAPASAVEPGNSAWASNHGRVIERPLDPRLALEAFGGKQRYELGEPILLELCLRNVSDQPVRVGASLEPSEGTIAVTIVGPDGTPAPFVPIDRTRCIDESIELAPGASRYAPLDLTVGRLGFPFKQPGRYRVEVGYLGLQGLGAVATTELEVAPAGEHEAVVRELFDARVGRVLYVDGTRVLGDVDDKLAWVEQRLGERHPISLHIQAVRFRGWARDGRIVSNEVGRIQRVAGHPDRAVHMIGRLMSEQLPTALETFGALYLEDLLEAYVDASLAAGDRTAPRDALRHAIALMRSKGTPGWVLSRLERRERLLGGSSDEGD